MPDFKRSESSIINLRVFHNWVKNELLHTVNNSLRQKYNEVNILELAVGKGGDMYKWMGINANEVIGFDIDKESINGKNGAYHRYNKLKSRQKYDNKIKPPKCSFYVMDLSEPKSFDKMKKILKDKKFHIVSCQFAMHYFFRDESALNTFTKMIGTFIHDNGYFIATTMNKELIIKLLEKKNKHSGEIYEIEKSYDLKSKYNNQYIVSLGDKGEDHYFAENKSHEFLADIDLLTENLSKYNVHLENKKTFDIWYSEYLKHDPESVMTNGEKEFSFLNLSVIYKKT